MSSTHGGSGRLCNHIFRNVCLSFIAKKHNLYVDYTYINHIKSLGIELFSGSNKYAETKKLDDDNYFDILTSKSINYNLHCLYSYFQTKDISLYLYNYLQEPSIQNSIIQANPFKDRINSNNDCFIHLRLTDAEIYGPGINYYLKALSMLTFDKLHIASDDLTHPVINTIIEAYPNSMKVELNDVQTIQFGSTNKYLVLSPGTFSAIIGYLSKSDQVLYPGIYKMWHGNIFSIPSWTKVIDY